MSLKSIATDFIQNYLQTLRHLASLIPSNDRGLFPFYWFKPVRIEIIEGIPNDIGISIIRTVSGKKDKIEFQQTLERIERAHFPNLDYSKWPLFNISENVHFTQIGYLTAVLGDHPFITLSKGCDVRIKDVRIEASAKGYPRHKEFLWFFISPNLEYLDPDIAKKEANGDFWTYIEWLVFTKLGDLISRHIERDTLSLFMGTLENLRCEYRQLISRQDLDEQMLQNYLEKHYYLISPEKAPKKEKRKIGPFLPDFVLRFGEDSTTLVEIQLNRDIIIEKDQPSKGLKEAVKQLELWFEWIQVNDPSTLSKYNGLIIIGRKENYEKNKKVINEIISKIKYPVKLKTYDDLEESINYIISVLPNV